MSVSVSELQNEPMSGLRSDGNDIWSRNEWKACRKKVYQCGGEGNAKDGGWVVMGMR